MLRLLIFEVDIYIPFAGHCLLKVSTNQFLPTRQPSDSSIYTHTHTKMKIFESSHSFNYPWEQVSAANWKKYPNEMSTQVVGVDVLRREVNPTTSVLKTERLITCEQPIPSWLNFLVGGLKRSYVREISEVDPINKTLTMRSINMTMSNLLQVYEVVSYKPDPANPLNKTLFKQEAQITAYASIKKLCNKVEDWSVDRFDFNAQRGKIGFESVLRNVNENWNHMKTSVLDEVNEKVNAFDGVTEKVKHGVFKSNSN